MWKALVAALLISAAVHGPAAADLPRARGALAVERHPAGGRRPRGGGRGGLQGLASAGLSLGPIGALLVTLPAVSLPGLAMVIRSFGPRVTAATTGVVVAGGMLGAALLAVL